MHEYINTTLSIYKLQKHIKQTKKTHANDKAESDTQLYL